ncbi:MAG: hypothetical protein L3K26_10395 [Candidatus Hydrogenedentes bacterium]|nr:hypothetical protein [Candidatus Hydrogenedentota bacterium]
MISVKTKLLLPCAIAVATLAFLAGCGQSTDPSDNAPTLEVPEPKEAPMSAESTPEPAPAPEIPAEPQPAPETPAEDWRIVPGERVGKITATSTEADLIAAYGAENVGDARFDLGEGEFEMGTGLFLDDEIKALRIRWADGEKKARPSSIQWQGVKSVWKTVEGISLGTSLTKVQELNGKAFKLLGFDWDYGGTLSDSNGGAIVGLSREDPEKGYIAGKLSLVFQPDYDGKPDFPEEKYAQVRGGSEFSSDHPVMQELNPLVYSMTVSFSEPIE